MFCLFFFTLMTSFFIEEFFLEFIEDFLVNHLGVIFSVFVCLSEWLFPFVVTGEQI